MTAKTKKKPKSQPTKKTTKSLTSARGQDKPKLTPKQSRFVDEYLVDLNATKAAIRAGYSEKTAKDIGCQTLAKVYISDAIQERRDKIQARTEITQERVLEEYAKIAFLDPAQLFDDQGDLKSIHEIPKEVAAAIGGLDHSTRRSGQDETEFIKKIKLVDKKGALDSIAKHLGMFEKDNAQKREPVKIIMDMGGRDNRD